MEKIYGLCDKIVANKVLSEEALEEMLLAVAHGRPKRKRVLAAKNAYDTFQARARGMNVRAHTKYHASGSVTPRELATLWETSNGCARCGATENLVFDHIVSLYRGGENTIDNLQILCRKCNMEKGVN